MSAVLSCENITVRFGGVAACDAVSLDVEQGRIVGLIGPNGAGKTTLFNVISRFQPFSGGRLMLAGENIGSRSPYELVALGLARTFQNIHLFGEQTVLSNILVGAHRLAAGPIASLLWTREARRRENELLRWAVEIAAQLKLEDELETPAGQLPYGMQKRVELARALASRPRIVLLDEPVAGCNDEETAELREFIKHINKDHGITVLLVEHDMSFVMDVCDEIHVINLGKNLTSGTPEQVQNHPGVIRAYLGEAA